MSKPLRVLILEAVADDALLVERQLLQAGYEVASERVETAEALRAALGRGPWDLIMSGDNLPHLSGPVALGALRASGLDLPFIIVSDTMREDEAVAAMKAGAHDYLRKGKLARLGLTVERELREAEQRRERKKQAEAALRDSEMRYRRLFEAAKDGILILDAGTGMIRDVNPFLIEMLGYSHEQFLGKKLWEIGSFKDTAVNEDKFLELQQQGYVRYEDLPLETAGGRRISVEFVSNVYLVDHQPVIQCNIRDLTERKQTGARLRRLAALLDAANDAIYVCALDHTVTYWNQGAERLYGWTRAQALGRKITELGGLDHARFAQAHAALLEQGSWSGELNKTSETGQAFVVFCRWTLLRDEQGCPGEILAINTDITEKKQLEANFLRAQRLESIGSLAGGVAHDLNNILAPILMTATLLRESVSDPGSRAMLGTIETCAQRGADIIKQLLTFARGDSSPRVLFPLSGVLNELDRLIRETFPRNIRLQINAPGHLWPVLGDATQIHQALMNLCVNARDAMPTGGTLTLAAENLTLDDAFAAVTPNAKPGTYVCVSVTDTGAGIPPENLDRIFEPFFTTKEIGKGTGLGLASVLGIARGHNGFVRVKSRVAQGTMFELYLPASPETKAAGPGDAAAPPPRGHGELILVVDDEVSVRRVIQQALERYGYRVITAAEGAAALALFAQHRAEVRAVVTDMMMPDMDGPALVQGLRHDAPRLPILGMTGLAERAVVKGLDALDLAVVLIKPFVGNEMLAALSRALG